MSVTLYDLAIKEKIKSWTLDDKLIILGVDQTKELFEYNATINNDRPLQLPLISIARGRDITITQTAKRQMSYAGKIFNSDGNISDHLNAIPISILYQINIYTRYLTEADEYVRNFVFNIINHPQITVKIPYNGCPLSYSSFITIEDTISDNSDIPERLISGQFTRMTLNIRLNDAYLFSYNRRNVIHIDDGTTSAVNGIPVKGISDTEIKARLEEEEMKFNPDIDVVIDISNKEN